MCKGYFKFFPQLHQNFVKQLIITCPISHPTTHPIVHKSIQKCQRNMFILEYYNFVHIVDSDIGYMYTKFTSSWYPVFWFGPYSSLKISICWENIRGHSDIGDMKAVSNITTFDSLVAIQWLSCYVIFYGVAFMLYFMVLPLTSRRRCNNLLIHVTVHDTANVLSVLLVVHGRYLYYLVHTNTSIPYLVPNLDVFLGQPRAHMSSLTHLENVLYI